MRTLNFCIAGAVLLVALSPVSAQSIYKTVDEEGNVTYTDQPPSPDAQPMDLPPITVADPYESRARSAEIGDEPVEELVPYADFRLLSPTQEEHFWGTGGTFTAQVASTEPLQPGHLVQFYLDGSLAGTGTGYFLAFNNIDRGEHTIRAEVTTPSGEVLARTEEVVFFMRQQTIINRSRN